MNTTIEKLLKACHEANIVHFPQGLIIRRAGSGWAIRVLRDEKQIEFSSAAHATGGTPEAALEALRQSACSAFEARQERHAKDAAAAREALLALRGSEP